MERENGKKESWFSYSRMGEFRLARSPLEKWFRYSSGIWELIASWWWFWRIWFEIVIDFSGKKRIDWILKLQLNCIMGIQWKLTLHITTILNMISLIEFNPLPVFLFLHRICWSIGLSFHYNSIINRLNFLFPSGYLLLLNNNNWSVSGSSESISSSASSSLPFNC